MHQICLGQKKSQAVGEVLLPVDIDQDPDHVTGDVPDRKNDSDPDLAQKTDPEKRNRDEFPVPDLGREIAQDRVLESDIASEDRHRRVLHREVAVLSDVRGPEIAAKSRVGDKMVRIKIVFRFGSF